jgi:plasmid stabilization system protein ParE
MEQRFRITVQRLASEDVETIYAWLRKRSPNGARRWYDAFHEAAKLLMHEPTRHALAPESIRVTEPVRQSFFKTRSGRLYRILYLIVGDEVRILRVRGPGQPLISEEDLGS